jgi:hypothetical protein
LNANKFDGTGSLLYVFANKLFYEIKGGIPMKQDYEKPELVVYEELSDITTGGPSKAEI